MYNIVLHEYSNLSQDEYWIAVGLGFSTEK